MESNLNAFMQESIVALVCNDNEAAAVLRGMVDESYFAPIFREVVSEAYAYIDAYGAAPCEHTIDIIETLKERNSNAAEQYEHLFNSLQELQSGDGVNARYVLDHVQTFMRGQRLMRTVDESLELMERQGIESVTEIEGKLRHMLDESLPTYDIGTSSHDPAGLLALLEDEEHDPMPTGIKALDRRGLGPPRRGLHLFAARPGMGKSLWLLWLARVAVFSGKRVLYVTLELSEREVWQRYLMSVHGIRKRRDQQVALRRFRRDGTGTFIDFDDTEIEPPVWGTEEASDRLRKRLPWMQKKAKMIVKQFPTGMLTVPELDGYLSILESRERFTPDLILVDYPDLMRLDATNLRTSTGEVYKQLRGLAVKRNIACAAVTQLNRGSARRRVATGEDAAEDYSKIATSDVFITFNQNPAEQRLGLARLFVSKGRTEEDKFTIVISQAYATSRFVVDEMGETADYWDRLNEEGE